MISLRPATIEDSRDLLDWRNDPVTRQNSFQQDEISLENHINWLEKVLSSSDRYLFIIQNDTNQNIGQVRFDQEDDRAEISLGLARTFQGRGYGVESIKYSSQKFLEDHKDITKIIAKIKEENDPSIGAFLKAGYQKYKQEEGVVEMKFEL